MPAPRSSLLLALFSLSSLSGASAQDPSAWRSSWSTPVLPADFAFSSRTLDERPTPRPATAIPLFRMPTAFLQDPLDIAPDADGPDSDGPLRVNAGLHNPFFDFRLRGDGGSVGHYKVQTQYQLYDAEGSGLSFGFHALTPAGFENNGLGRGPTQVNSSFAWYQQIDDGVFLHGFVGANVRANSAWDENIGRSFEYGIAFQSLVPDFEPAPDTSLHVFVEVLGRQRFNDDPGLSTRWGVLPGLHLRLGEDQWISGGVLVPYGLPRSESLWHLTWFCRF